VTKGQKAVCDEILELMEEYDSQLASRGGVDTPGGLEHMGDVWRLLNRWRGWINEKEEDSK